LTWRAFAGIIAGLVLMASAQGFLGIMIGAGVLIGTSLSCTAAAIAEGKTLAYTYDTRSNVLTVTSTPKPGSPLAPLVTAYSYDPIYNKPTQIVDPLGLVTSMSYDGATGNLTTTTSDVGSSPHFNAQRSFAYNNVGQVLTATDPLGIVTQLGYDSFGNQTSIIRDIGPGRLNQLTTIGYSAVGDPISITDPRANITTNTYDAARRLTATTAPNGLMTAYSYDPDGHVSLDGLAGWKMAGAEGIVGG
jgi:YD repeat-containing protein